MLHFNNWFELKRNKSSLVFSLITAVAVVISCVNFAWTSHVDKEMEERLMASESEENNPEPENNKEERAKEVEIKNNSNDDETKVKKAQQTLQNPPISSANSSTNNYQNLYPDLYCTPPQTRINPDKTIFLTFDDGPSERTLEILNILREKGVKATFFVTGSCPAKGKSIMKKIVDEGHTIGVHTYTHDFKNIYASVEAFLDDFNKIYNLIYEATGVKPTIFRFPGGSKNGFNKGNYRELIAEMTRRGFVYFDWNLSAGDAVSRTPTPTSRCISNVLNASKNCAHGVVLMHDAMPKVTTVEALPAIIDGLRSQGFSFDKLFNKINSDAYSIVKP